MSRPTLRFLSAALAVACLVVFAPSSSEAKKKKKRTYYHHRYVVEFTCGINELDAPRVVPGEYSASINVYNPTGDDAVITKNLALSFPPGGQVAGPVSDPIMEVLESKKALQVSCAEIESEEFIFDEPVDAPYLQGFLVIESRRPLVVRAVHTATGATGEVAIDVEQIPARTFGTKNPGDKVTICHMPPGNPGNAHSISIDVDSWPAHRDNHSDSMGPCN